MHANLNSMMGEEQGIDLMGEEIGDMCPVSPREIKCYTR